jgi:hypothetical protein
MKTPGQLAYEAFKAHDDSLHPGDAPLMDWDYVPEETRAGWEKAAAAVDTLAHAREDLRAKARKGATCPLCTQHVKVYRRGLGSNMAVFLCLSLKHFGKKWFSVPDQLAPLLVDPYRNVLNGGDYAKLEWWELLESDDGTREDGSPRTGWFRVTDAGEAFARGWTEVASHSLSYNGKLIRLDESKKIKIHNALRKRFNYTELMGAA